MGYSRWGCKELGLPEHVSTLARTYTRALGSAETDKDLLKQGLPGGSCPLRWPTFCLWSVFL